ncbi:MAG: ABC transporter permease [bacterium]|nr:ABC transporter permease [bacterium]
MKAYKAGISMRRVLLNYLGLIGVLIALVAAFGLCTDQFLTYQTFDSIANQIPTITVVSIGMTFVLIIAGIDLSVGSVLGLSGGLLGYCLVDAGIPLGLAIPACLLAGALCGLGNGYITVRWRIPSFIVTLGMLEIARGASYLITSSRTEYIGMRIGWIADVSLGGLSLPFLVAVGTVALGQGLLTRTVFGRYAVAIGTNEEAVRLSGIDPRPVQWAIFTMSGFLAALGALLQAARMQSAEPNAGYGMELQAIAAVVIGGTSLMGGRGSVIGTFFGVLIIAVLGTGLAQIGVQDPTKRLITGCVIVVAVILDHYRRH